MKSLIYGALCGLAWHSAGAGTIKGTIHAKGLADAAETSGGGGAYDSKRYKFAETTDYNSIHDFVVYIDGPIPGTQPPPGTNRIAQKGVEFVPHVLPIMVGSTVEFPNEDEIYHNVFSKSPVNAFNLGMYKKGEKPGKPAPLFDKPGEVDIFCSIHSKMSCVVLVLENPYFATNNARGHYEIPHVPAGTYKLVGWQERLFSHTNVVTVPETGEIQVNFELGPDAKP